MSDPMRVVNAPTGMRLFPKVMDWMLRSSEVEFGMVGGRFKGHAYQRLRRKYSISAGDVTRSILFLGASSTTTDARM